jgi:hypothetical protein
MPCFRRKAADGRRGDARLEALAADATNARGGGAMRRAEFGDTG